MPPRLGRLLTQFEMGMNSMTRDFRRALLLATVFPMATFGAHQASAQGASSGAAAAEVGEVIVTGMRGRPRVVQDTPVPVDVFSEQALKAATQTDTLNTLTTLIPSYSVPRSANSTSNTFIRAPSLRGLSADKTLLLMNSKRRHKSASVGVSGSGSQSADAAVIPAIALKSVEVLRDGAAAQYGSDAIAGVINFMLKDASSGGSITAQAGQYYEGDGDDYLVAGNIGLPLTESGFLNLSGQWTQSLRTIRANQFSAPAFDAIAYAAANPSYAAAVDLSEPLQRTGRPKEWAWRFIANSGIDLTDNTSIYAFGNYSRSRGIAAANYRYPGGGHVVLDNPVRLQDGSIFRFNQLYPGGLRPEFSGDVTDWSAATGYRTSIDFDEGRSLKIDIGVRYGWDEIAYAIVGTLNPSMGPTSPNDFTASSYVNDELSFNADMAYETPVSWAVEPLVISFGAEYRQEGFKIRPGEPNSYLAGDFSRPDPFDFCTNEPNVSARTLRPGAPQNMGINCSVASDAVYRVLSVGSNGITGLPPSATGAYETSSYSFYAEGSTDITEKFYLNVAGRFEHYDAFGSKVIGKVAGRYEFSDGFAMRGSVGTGFRAPTAGQLNMTQIAILTVDGIPTNTGLYPASHPVSEFLGAKPLKPETSVNYSIGLTANPMPGMALSIDAYRVEVSDQLYSTAQIPVTPAIAAAMTAAGVPGAESIGSVNFFQNAFDATVQGVDVVGSYRYSWENGQSTDLVASFNYNQYKVGKVKIAGLFSDQLTYNFENNNPDWRGTLTATHKIGDFTLMARGNVYGPYSRQSTTTPFPIQKYDPELMVDAEVEYRLTEAISVAAGARNLFDNYPNPNRINASNGTIYADGAVDWQGGFYYARVNYTF
jgi:iron complex outermembrane receptor protein